MLRTSEAGSRLSCRCPGQASYRTYLERGSLQGWTLESSLNFNGCLKLCGFKNAQDPWEPVGTLWLYPDPVSVLFYFILVKFSLVLVFCSTGIGSRA